MCGILGSSKSPSSTVFNEGLRVMQHRGPDYTGVFSDEFLSLGHLLLAIRGDTDESLQPVKEQNSPWVLAFNGQIYNTRKIKALLGGSAVQSEVDTQILYALIKKMGWDFISHIEGMFSIALYHKETHILKLYRDGAGQKNLYYTMQGGVFSFASEIKGLLSLGDFSREIDTEGLEIAASIGYIPGHKTLIKNIYKLHPSEVLTYECSSQKLSKAYFYADTHNDYRDLMPDEVMAAVIDEHLQSKRDISINLSGGLDSSLIFHEAVQRGGSIQAFSTNFVGGKEKYNTDFLIASKLANDYGQRLTPIHITKESYLEHFIQAYELIEEPNFNVSLPAYYQTARAEGIHGAGLRVVLSGDGGDELFGGYPHYLRAQQIERFKNIIGTRGLNMYKRMRGGKNIDYGSVADEFYAFRSFSKSWLHNKEAISTVLPYLDISTRDLISNTKKKDSDMYKLMVYDRFVWLANENFIRSDKLYMSQSMEMRCPLAYSPLRRYMDQYIHKNEYISKANNKLFLRKLYNEKLPHYITHRKDKTGWRASIEDWYDAKYKKLFLEIISDAKANSQHINWGSLQKYIESKDTWPGKEVHLYLSLAILIKSLKLE